MKKLLSIFKKLDGSKTVIGLVLLQFAPLLPAHEAILSFLGNLLTGAGIAHKAVKAVN